MEWEDKIKKEIDEKAKQKVKEETEKERVIQIFRRFMNKLVAANSQLDQSLQLPVYESESCIKVGLLKCDFAVKWIYCPINLEDSHRYTNRDIFSIWYNEKKNRLQIGGETDWSDYRGERQVAHIQMIINEENTDGFIEILLKHLCRIHYLYERSDPIVAWVYDVMRELRSRYPRSIVH